MVEVIITLHVTVMESYQRTRYFDKLRNLSRLTGFILDEKINKNETIRLWLLPLISYLYCGLILSKKWSLDDDINDYLFTVGLASAVPRVTIMRINRTRLANLLESLEYYDGRELKPYLKASINNVGVVLSHVGIVAVATVVVGWYFSHTERILPFGSMPSWATEYNLILCLLFQIVLFSFLANDYLMADALKWCILLQLRMHFKYFKSNIKGDLDIMKREHCQPNISSPHTNQDVTIPWSNLQKHIKNITLSHDRLCSIANATESVFNKCVLVSFVNLSFLFCVILFRMSKIPLYGIEFCQLLFYILVNSSMFFGDIFLCQQVVTESEGLVLSYYETDFVGADIRFQKALVLLMTRAQKSIIFSIGNFAPLSMGTIVTVINTSVSYFMLLRNLRRD